MKKILFLLANPQDKDIAPLNLDQELGHVERALERAIDPNQFEVLIRWAARVEDLRRELLHEKPQIVHFSGHGADNYGLVLETEFRKKEFVSTEALAGLFELCQDYVECVLLNACYSETQAIAIHRHINYVIGMNQAILDGAAIQFAIGFYDALAAGRSYKDAYEVGCNAIALKGIKDSAGASESLIPVLKARRWGAARVPNSEPVASSTTVKDPVEAKPMMPQEKPSQSISISGANVSGQVAQAGGNVTQNQHINHGTGEKQLTTTEVVSLIAQIEALLTSSVLADEQKHKTMTHLEAAKEAAKEEEPDKDYAAKSLQKAARILKGANETVGAGEGLWKRVEPVLTQLLPWLGVTPHFFGF